MNRGYQSGILRADGSLAAELENWLRERELDRAEVLPGDGRGRTRGPAPQAQPAPDAQPIVVERAMYSDAGGQIWAAGTSANATPVP